MANPDGAGFEEETVQPDTALSESEAETIRGLLSDLGVEIPDALEHLISGQSPSELTYRILRDEIQD